MFKNWLTYGRKVIYSVHTAQRHYISAVSAESHYLPFSALFRTFDSFPHLFALFIIFRTISHYLQISAHFCTILSIKTSRKVGCIGTQTWKVLVLKVGKYWHQELEIIGTVSRDLESIGTDLESIGTIACDLECIGTRSWKVLELTWKVLVLSKVA